MAMPDDVQDDFGFGLGQAQQGEHPDIGKPMKGFGGADVIELTYDKKGDAFRAVYTVKFEEVVIVLHAFQKKSNYKRETPKKDVDLIHSRLKSAKKMYEEWKLRRQKK